jgi:C4-type Zn-finger protein
MQHKEQKKIHMKCPVCKRKWSEEETSVKSPQEKDIQRVKKIFAPCGHGHAYLVRYYDTASHLWYYEQIDFIRAN